jgi:hypothetical protein
MGIMEDLGVADKIPSISLTGFFSSTWIYVAIAVVVGLILIGAVILILFLKTFNKKVILFENISGQGYQPILKTRARTVKLGVGGEEILKTFGGKFVSAYGRKMGRNTFWFAKGQDGYWYNIVLGDLDSKRAMLDIEPIDRDVRMFHVALDRLSHQTYGKNSFLEKYGIHLLLFVFLIVLILGMWFIVGKIGDAIAPLSEATKNSAALQEANAEITSKLASIVEKLGITSTTGGSGIVPAG